MKWPSLSVIIPSFNQGKFIERTVLSVLKQEYEGALQIIVSDGGSTDDTVKVLKKYPQVIWWSEPDKGFSDAVTKALQVSTGDIVAIQSSDDFYLPEAFKKAISVLVQNPQYSLATGAEIVLLENQKDFKLGSKAKSELVGPRSISFPNLNIPQHCTFVYRHAIDQVGGMQVEADRCGDFALWYRILHFSKAVVLPDYLGVCQVHPNQRMQARANDWIKSIRYVIESCERDKFYPNIFVLTESQKNEVYLAKSIHWNYYAGGEIEKTEATSIAKAILKDHKQYSKKLVSFATHYAGETSILVKMSQAIKMGIFFQKSLNHIRDNLADSKKNAFLKYKYSTVINWWKS